MPKKLPETKPNEATQSKPKKKNGRPSTFTQEWADEFCAIISSMPKSIRTICAENAHFPDDAQVHRWLVAQPSFRRQYADAKRDQVSVIVDNLIDLQDGVKNKLDYDKSRLQSDNHKWIACKLAPKVYGSQAIIDGLESEKESLKAKLMELQAQLLEQHKKEY